MTQEISPQVHIRQSFEPVSPSDWLIEHDIHFRPLHEDERYAFWLQCEVVLERQAELALSEEMPDLPNPSPVFIPNNVLVKPLSDAQVTAIDDQESHRFADYAASIQTAIAQVPILESGERLVHLPSIFNHEGQATFNQETFPNNSGKWSGKPQEFWVRESLATRLTMASRLLDAAGAKLHFIEAFRPAEVQAAMFTRRITRTAQEHPDWTDQQILTEAKSKTASTPRLASHMGGAAVDLWPRDKHTNQLLDFGHIYPSGGALVAPGSPFLTTQQWLNRQLLQLATGLAGLTMYVGEDWHVSFDDNLASLDENDVVTPSYSANFGPIRDFDRKTGEIKDVFESGDIDRLFAILPT